MIDLTKYPRMAAMLARRDPNRKSLSEPKPMREIPEAWSFDADGVRKIQLENTGKENGNQKHTEPALRASEDARVRAVGNRKDIAIGNNGSF